MVNVKTEWGIGPSSCAIYPTGEFLAWSKCYQNMETQSKTPIAQSRFKHWLRVLRPIFWWLILVLLLFAYHTHQRLSEQTRISFKVDLEGKPVEYEASVTLDGRRVVSGERVSLGSHQFAVSLPKAEPISTNLFIWYGERDLGAISLKRTRGILALEIKPPAARLSVTGAEFSVILTNSAGITSSVPTDVYSVDAHWGNYEEKQSATITTGATGFLRLAPPLGAISLESDPSGASVIGSDGSALGTTPLTLRELLSGAWKGELRLDGYIRVPLSLSITASETNSFRTNLANWQYSQAMESAKASFAAGNMERTLEALSSALKAKPSDPDATALQEQAAALQQQAVVAGHLRKAAEMMAAKNYDGVRSEAEAVLRLLPENAQALALLKEISNREQENKRIEKEREIQQAEAQRQERLALPKKTFDLALGPSSDASLFETHELQAGLPVAKVQAAIWQELSTAPAFNVMRIKVSSAESFALSARQEVSGGYRYCVIAGAQTGDKGTHFFFKVMEYKNKHSVTLTGGLSFNTSFVPLDPSRIAELTEKEKAQIKDGAVMVEERIRRAVGQKSP
jgi:tetratricopeptide (TPR) repeat protein